MDKMFYEETKKHFMVETASGEMKVKIVLFILKIGENFVKHEFGLIENKLNNKYKIIIGRDLIFKLGVNIFSKPYKMKISEEVIENKEEMENKEDIEVKNILISEEAKMKMNEINHLLEINNEINQVSKLPPNGIKN